MGGVWSWLTGSRSYGVEQRERRASHGSDISLHLIHEGEESSDTDSSTPVPAPRPYSFSVREQLLTGPPQMAPRRFSFVDYLSWRLGGSFSGEPEDMVDGHSNNCSLSDTTQEVLRQCFEDIDPRDIVDYHVHIVGHGDSGSECYLHPTTKSWWYPLRRIKSLVFMAAAQVPSMENGDIQYMSRLLRLVKHFVPASLAGQESTPEGRYLSGRFCMLPFDKFYEKNGRPNIHKTTMYIPNDYSIQLSREFPEYFCPVASVNPYRRDALEELQRCADNGATIVKWLPNSMGIDPRDRQCIAFYEKMKELGMALLIHVGSEHSVDAGFIDNSLGNPLHMRAPLDCGVKVIAAHCGTEGNSMDYEGSNASVPSFHLFLRLMHEERYKGLLFGDISAVCAFLRVGFLVELLQATDVHDRLVYGSDYPVPAINLVVHTSKMQRLGLITPHECTALNELYNYNPLLFDFACKRLARGQRGERFPPALFKAHPLLPPCRQPQSSDSGTALQSSCHGEATGEGSSLAPACAEEPVLLRDGTTTV